ncbi:serine/threonine-protein kinase pelle isoform X2 [Drosophila teissieri]|uniref:serine/threonine-protein kinase pelle isoform X2 n=1 Tax=Drosophila teissieri TaxID=7243 RepID=UPI001CBA0BC6|nr:serine/threonine-protein kinase pelle isoform X2 [Drosophila teissieri]
MSGVQTAEAEAQAQNQANGNRTRSRSHIDDSMPIRLMPLTVRAQLCAHLDALDVWHQMATTVKLYPDQVEQIRSQKQRGRSASNEFLTIWGGQYGHTMRSLFILFRKILLTNAMLLIKDYVSEDLHQHIPRSRPNITELRAAPDSSAKVNNGPPFPSSSGVSNSNNNRTSTAATEAIPSLESLDNIHHSTVQRAAESLLQIDYAELENATDGWSPQNRLGQGGFGDVYRGKWMQLDVAIKVMNYRSPNIDQRKVELQQSYNELRYLNSIRHDNIVALYGYSVKGAKPCLVYQLMKGGSLEARLRAHKAQNPLPALTWQQRFNISLGTARGIYFLHTARGDLGPLIHGDIKPANILLDQCMQPKIGDFGLVREGPKSLDAVVEVNKVFGTKIYLPPEFLNSKKLSTGLDVYSFGIVLLEVFTGRQVTDRVPENETKKNLLDYVKQQWRQNRRELLEKHLAAPMGKELDMCMCAIETGLNCTALNLQNRPSMHAVLMGFEPFETE